MRKRPSRHSRVAKSVGGVDPPTDFPGCSDDRTTLSRIADTASTVSEGGFFRELGRLDFTALLSHTETFVSSLNRQNLPVNRPRREERAGSGLTRRQDETLSAVRG